MKFYLFLDDRRYPKDVSWISIPIKPWSIVRNYDQFIDSIQIRGVPDYVCYDHDLADSHYGDGLDGDLIDYSSYKEKTGYDCAKWLVNYCSEKNIKHPPYLVHSLNPAGVKNIKSYIENYNKFFENGKH